MIAEYWERDFTATERKTAAKSGNAMSYGSYPINNTSDLKNAIQAFGRASTPDAVKEHIKTRAKALGATSALPATWESSRVWVTGGDLLNESAYDASTGQLTVTIIKPGWSKNARYYSPELLKKSVGIFEGCKMFADHATDKEAAARPEGSVKDWVASLGKPWVEADGTIKSKACVIDPPFKAKLDLLHKNNQLSQMGVSIRAYGEGHNGEFQGKKGKIIESLLGARSVDFVTFAGAGGQVDAIESALSEFDVDVVTEAQLRERRPDLITLIESGKVNNMENKEGMGYCLPMSAEDHAGKAASFQAKADELKAGEKKDANQAAADAHGKAADSIKDAHKAAALASLHEESAGGNEDAMINKQNEKLLKEANEKIAALESANKKKDTKAELTKLLSEAKLPKVAVDRIEKHFAEADKTDGMKEMIASEAEYIKSLGGPIPKKNGAADTVVVTESERQIGEYKERQYRAYIAGGDDEVTASRLSGFTPRK
jgi:hypothetical protein